VCGARESVFQSERGREKEYVDERERERVKKVRGYRETKWFRRGGREKSV